MSLITKTRAVSFPLIERLTSSFVRWVDTKSDDESIAFDGNSKTIWLDSDTDELTAGRLVAYLTVLPPLYGAALVVGVDLFTTVASVGPWVTVLLLSVAAVFTLLMLDSFDYFDDVEVKINE